VSTAAGDARPLAGRGVLVTRPRAQADALVQHLKAVGATVIVASTIRVVPPEDRTPLVRAAADISQFDWIVFASANAVDAFVSAAAEVTERATVHAPGGVQWPPLLKTAVVGSATAERLRSHGIEATVIPSEFRAEALVEALAAHGPLSSTRVLVPRSEIGRDTIVLGLRAAGAVVTDVIAYRTIAELPEGNSPDVPRMLANRELDAVTFTSGSAVRHFVQAYGPHSVELLGHTVVAVMGPVTAEAARELGISVDVQPETYTAAAMVAALEAYFGGEMLRIESPQG
jgi:uroporphyrinogen III methyltransferase / synthase